MVQYAKAFPERFYDVAIAEQHSVTLAAGMACDGLKPVLAIYSTFLQRGYDQLIHDVALQSLDVTLAIDRAGLVGQDGPTHHGTFDLSICVASPTLWSAHPARKISADKCCKVPGSMKDPRQAAPHAGKARALRSRLDSPRWKSVKPKW